MRKHAATSPQCATSRRPRRDCRPSLSPAPDWTTRRSNSAIDRFARQALEANAALELINHPEGRHAFDILDDDARSREIIARTVEFLKAQLLAR